MRKIHWNEIEEKGIYFHLAASHFKAGEIFGMHYHDFAELTLITAGSGFNVHNDKRYPLEKGNLIFSLPQTTHALYAGSKGLKLMNLAFLLPYAKKLENKYFSEEPGYFNNEEAAGIPIRISEENLNQILSLLHQVSGKNRSLFYLDYCLMNIYAVIRNSLHHSSFTAAPDWLIHTCHQIQSDKNSCPQLKDFYQMAGRSPEHVARQMKKYTGMSPVDYINEIKLEKAARLLCTEDLSILEISLECGFENLSWFHRCFKKKYRITPLQYRKSNRYPVTR